MILVCSISSTIHFVIKAKMTLISTQLDVFLSFIQYIKQIFSHLYAFSALQLPVYFVLQDD